MQAMRLVLAAFLLILIARPGLAEFTAAEAALRRGEHAMAYEHCKAEAEKGDPECQNLLGVLFQKGLGVTEDLKEAIRLFTAAAGKKLAAAQVNLGLLYLNGTGVARDETEAAPGLAWPRIKETQSASIASHFCYWPAKGSSGTRKGPVSYCATARIAAMCRRSFRWRSPTRPHGRAGPGSPISGIGSRESTAGTNG
jgi:hypothetical protein